MTKQDPGWNVEVLSTHHVWGIVDDIKSDSSAGRMQWLTRYIFLMQSRSIYWITQDASGCQPTEFKQCCVILWTSSHFQWALQIRHQTGPSLNHPPTPRSYTVGSMRITCSPTRLLSYLLGITGSTGWSNTAFSCRCVIEYMTNNTRHF